MKKLVTFCVLLTWLGSAEAAIVQLDYSFDAANGNFFGTNPIAKAAVDAAAQDIGNAITSSLGAITTNAYTGTNGSTSATFTWSFDVTNPSTGATFTQNTFNTPVNLMTVYVGMRPLTGVTLGIGGPGGGGYGLGYGGFASQLVGAMANAESASNMAMKRGAGPIIGSYSGSATLGATTANFNVGYGATLGSLSFDSDSDNNGTADSAAQLAAYWHYDHTTPVAAGKNDLYSVALHEILHAIGFGTSDTWNSKRSGTDWTGSNVITLQGSGTNLVSADGGHIADGTMSTRISDGGAQEAVMDPSITVGTRKSLTQLDLAFLRDLNFTTVPEPSVIVLFGGTVLLLSLLRRRNLMTAAA